MTWSYSGDPAASDLDTVRFHLQDTDSDDQLMPDEEIQFVIDQWQPVTGSLVFAAAVCANKLAAKFAREVAVSGDGVSVGVEALQQKYTQMAADLRAEYKEFVGSGGAPTAGGTLFDEAFDSSIKPLSFGKGMHDNHRAGAQDRAGTGRTASWDNWPEDAI